MRQLFFIHVLLLPGLYNPCALFAQQTVYKVEGGAIVGNSLDRYNNRPLYINNTNAFILTGDRPIARLAKDHYLYGTLMLAVERDGKAKWLQQCDRIKSIYQPGKMAWEISDKDLPGLVVLLDVVPMAKMTGMAVRVWVNGVQPGDRLIWSFGGAEWRRNQNLSWKLDVMGQPELLTWGFIPEACTNNRVETTGQTCYIILMDSANRHQLFSVAGRCSSELRAGQGDASAWNDPARFLNSKARKLPLLYGVVDLESGKEVFLTFEAFNQYIDPGLSKVNDPDNSFADLSLDASNQSNDLDISRVIDPEKAFAEGLARIGSFRDRLKIDTPDPYLNAVARASVAAVDGAWYPPVFVHGCMQWNVPFPGWRTIFGGTMYGWHDRVVEEARYYTGSQVKGSDKTEAKADPATLLTEQHPDSRFYGVGRILQDQRFYNMQTQFFDQIVEEYRWTADPELVTFFREALELHLIWIRDCFDPDGDGVYESYINVWPTDSQWYNGGGTAEETSYAYRGHLAARDMARNAGDAEGVKYHSQMLDKIRKGFFEKLWIQDAGHSGSYREQGGHGRLHKNPWLYSIFLPVDAGLTSPLQAIESVYYSEWALQNDRMPSGGRMVWTSNWVPPIWSVRELWPGDNYHLALSYFQAGLPDDGLDIMRGSFMHTAFNHLTPGNLGGMQGGIDFGDCVPTFARALVSGLFGYNPDYPNNKVRISPQFPADWESASIELPDFTIAYNRQGNKTGYSIEIARKADLELLLPVQCTGIHSITVNGKPADWELLPAVGRSTLRIQVPGSVKAEVVVDTEDVLPYYGPVTIEGNIGDIVQISAQDGEIMEFEDPQSVLDHEKIENGRLTAMLTANAGHHTVVARSKVGEALQLRVFRIKVNDPLGDARREARIVRDIPANATWETIDIRPLLNADITTVYKQRYLSPRPNTVSVRLGTDGYSPWTFWHWNSTPPAIKLDNIFEMLDGGNRLHTPQDVPFDWYGHEENVAFTSMWDNYPAEIEFPVRSAGRAVFFLVSGSTNVMQCQIANAVLRLKYADGQTDSLELVPPVNYWNLSGIFAHATATGQDSRSDYIAARDRFCLPAILPERVQLGENCRAMLLNLKLREGVLLESVTLETLSQEVVVGLMGITLMK